MFDFKFVYIAFSTWYSKFSTTTTVVVIDVDYLASYCSSFTSITYVFRADKERILFSCTQSIFFYYNNTTLKMTDPTLRPPSSPSTPQPSAATNHGGRLSATILSVYDIPTDDKYGSESCPVPSYVSMSVLGREVRTGKPSAKHKSMNNFKFVSADKSSPGKCTLGVSIFNNMYLFNLVSCRDEIILIFQPLFSNKYT